MQFAQYCVVYSASASGILVDCGAGLHNLMCRCHMSDAEYDNPVRAVSSTSLTHGACR